MKDAIPALHGSTHIGIGSVFVQPNRLYCGSWGRGPMNSYSAHATTKADESIFSGYVMSICVALTESITSGERYRLACKGTAKKGRRAIPLAAPTFRRGMKVSR